MTYLFLATIGPVQSFIASARRTRDLWFGSTLLSELSKTAARTIFTETKDVKSLIFPAPDKEEDLDPNSDPKVANKILARIECNPEQLGSKIDEALQRDIRNIYKGLFATLKNYDFDQNAAKQQIKDLIEFSWVALEEDQDQTKRDLQYHKKRQELEALLAARKNTRDYGKVTWHSHNPKSSIDGQLESVIPEILYPRIRETPQTQAEKVLNLFKQFRAGRSERLSGVDLMKRLGEFPKQNGQNSVEPDFFSTSHIASLPYLQRLGTLYTQSPDSTKKAIETSWSAYLDSVRGVHLPDSPVKNGKPPTGKWIIAPVDEHIPKSKPPHPVLKKRDGALLYGERLFEDAGNPDRLSQATKALQDFFATINNYAAPETLSPIPYYAIIAADGDGMGKVIDQESQSEQGLTQHRKVSQALDDFSQQVTKIVEGKDGSQGTLVYAGGDDVLAFVPLHRVLTCACTLSATFKEKLDTFKNDEGNKPTLSVGIAIVHHLSQLSDALEQARTAEKAAKKVPEKDALAIKLYKRGGEEYTISSHWGNLNIYLEELIKHYRANRIPKGLPYEIRESLFRLTALQDTKHSADLIEAIKADAKRILKRKLQVPKRKKHAETSALLQLLASRINIQLDEQDLPKDSTAQHQTENNVAPLINSLQNRQELDIPTFFSVMENYIHELIIARELADALNLAEGRPVTQEEEVQA